MLVSGSEEEGAALAAWQGYAASGGEHYWTGLVLQLQGREVSEVGWPIALLCAVKPACYCECPLLHMAMAYQHMG